MLFFLLMLNVFAKDSAQSTATDSELWAGEILLSGERRVPVLGAMTYTSRARLLATVVRSEAELDFSLRHCSLDFPKTPAVKLNMAKESARVIPENQYTLKKSANGWSVKPFVTAWDSSDLDKDGHPGITMDVDSLVCGGRLMLSNKATTTATNIIVSQDGYSADYNVVTEQTVLGTKGLCLRLMTKSMTDTMTGSTRYKRVAQGTTCDTFDWSSIYATERVQPEKEVVPIETAPQ